MNVQELADAMISLAQSDELRREMGQNGYQRAHRYFRIEQMQQKYREIYQSFTQESLE